ncbi:TetR/AcrR family transcriptional regulator [Zobellella aerophila]|uniref:TetR/AcrR family transcriptional regulator n=1 Tax=Zobellella aerophila TaxID=870480 RepID=A0ABP6W4Q2_9GAMM
MDAQKKTRRTPRPRNAVASRQDILDGAMKEFCAKGFDGARTEDIARRAQINIRMLYHYFGNKERLYQACLEKVYEDLRAKEAEIDLLHLSPEEAIVALVDFTFEHMLAHPEFIRMVEIENIHRGKFLKTLQVVPERGAFLIDMIRDVLLNGEADGSFRTGIDPFQLYISILSLCYVHLSNQYTLSITFNKDLGQPEWLAERNQHVRELILAYLNRR